MYYNWQSVSVSGTTKRLIFNASLQLAYGAGNIIGPITYSVSANPKTPMIVMIVLYGLNCLFVGLISLIHKRWNLRNEARMSALEGAVADEQLQIDLSDLTDKERPNFHYPR